jgi:hypothetical protein
MAGALTIDTLNASTNVLATQNGMTGIAKAWVNFNGTGTVAIRSSFNVSSVVRNDTGDYTINFTTAMPTANYGAVGNATGIGPTDSTPNGTVSTYSATTTAYRFQTGYRGNNFDPGRDNYADCRVAIFSA